MLADSQYDCGIKNPTGKITVGPVALANVDQPEMNIHDNLICVKG